MILLSCKHKLSKIKQNYEHKSVGVSEFNIDELKFSKFVRNVRLNLSDTEKKYQDGLYISQVNTVSLEGIFNVQI